MRPLLDEFASICVGFLCESRLSVFTYLSIFYHFFSRLEMISCRERSALVSTTALPDGDIRVEFSLDPLEPESFESHETDHHSLLELVHRGDVRLIFCDGLVERVCSAGNGKTLPSAYNCWLGISPGELLSS
jgi:hypothetical protein